MVADANDIFALLCHFFWNGKLDNVSITMKMSDGSVIDINTSALQLGEEFKDLLVVHALTGCDTTSYPFGKGKISVLRGTVSTSALEILFKSPKELLHKVDQHFFCLLYGSATNQTLCQLRYKVFSNDSPKIKSLPTTVKVAHQYFLRAHLQLILWRSARTTSNGYYKIGMETCKLIPQSIVGVAQMIPPELLNIVACGCIADKACSRNACSCKVAGLSCMSYCKCLDQENCYNPYKITRLTINA